MHPQSADWSRTSKHLTSENEATQKRLVNILESISDGFVTLDRQWRYTYVNQKAGQFLNRRAEDLLGKISGRSFQQRLDKNFTKLATKFWQNSNSRK